MNIKIIWKNPNSSCFLLLGKYLPLRHTKPKAKNASDRRLVAILGDFHTFRHLESSHPKVLGCQHLKTKAPLSKEPHFWVSFDSFTRVQTISQNDWFTISTALTGTHGWGYLDFNEHNDLKIYTPKIALQNCVFLWSEFLFQTLNTSDTLQVFKSPQLWHAMAHNSGAKGTTKLIAIYKVFAKFLCI